MGEKRLDKVVPRPVSDDPADGMWVEIDCETDTGAFAIVADASPPVPARPFKSGESREESKPPMPRTGGNSPKRRTLDDMRLLSEEIKRKRQSGR